MNTTVDVGGQSFYLDCVNHLSRLENKMDQMREAQPGPSQLKIDALVEILAEIVDFSDSQLSESHFESIVPRIKQLHDRTHEVRETISAGSWSFKKLFGGNSANQDEVSNAYNGLREHYAKFVVEYFVGFVKQLEASDVDRHSLLQSIDFFTTELEKNW